MTVRVLTVLGAYLVGSIPTGILVARGRGIDLRAIGSGNIGATNVARALGKRWGLVTLLGDLLKGLLPTLGAVLWIRDTRWVAGVGLAAFLGHLYPAFARFRGGKGAATAVGVCLAAAPLAGAAAFVSYVAVYAKTRISSAGSLAGTTLAVLVAPFVTRERIYLGLFGLLAALIWWRHRDNIERLLRGEEKPT